MQQALGIPNGVQTPKIRQPVICAALFLNHTLKIAITENILTFPYLLIGLYQLLGFSQKDYPHGTKL